MKVEKNNPLPPPDRALVLTRVFAAPRSLVFAVFAKKDHIDQWMAPHGFTIPESSGDFREGGAWHCLMIAPNGEHYPVGGVYQTIVPDELIITTHAWEDDDGKPEHPTTLKLSFADAGPGQTTVTLEQSIFKSVESRDGHQGGWTQCLDKLAELLARLQTGSKS